MNRLSTIEFNLQIIHRSSIYCRSAAIATLAFIEGAPMKLRPSLRRTWPPNPVHRGGALRPCSASQDSHVQTPPPIREPIELNHRRPGIDHRLLHPRAGPAAHVQRSLVRQDLHRHRSRRSGQTNPRCPERAVIAEALEASRRIMVATMEDETAGPEGRLCAVRYPLSKSGV